jgi:hypothetical protein
MTSIGPLSSPLCISGQKNSGFWLQSCRWHWLDRCFLQYWSNTLSDAVRRSDLALGFSSTLPSTSDPPTTSSFNVQHSERHFCTTPCCFLWFFTLRSVFIAFRHIFRHPDLYHIFLHNLLLCAFAHLRPFPGELRCARSGIRISTVDKVPQSL